MSLATADAITLTVHQLQRLVAGYIDLDCLTLDQIAARIFQQAALCGCEECRETVGVLKEFGGQND